MTLSFYVFFFIFFQHIAFLQFGTIDVLIHVPFSPVDILEHRHFGFMDVSARRYFNTLDVPAQGCYGTGMLCFGNILALQTFRHWNGDFSTP